MSEALTELWSAVNTCLWSCIAQSAGAQEFELDGRHFRIVKLVMRKLLRQKCTVM